MGDGAAAGAGLCWRTPEPSDRAYQVFDRSDWAWEFLRRNTSYESDWRDAPSRNSHALMLSDGTILLRLRRRYARAEKWGLFAFADPGLPARDNFVAWLPTVTRTITARCTSCNGAANAITLAIFHTKRVAVATVDGYAVIALKGHTACMHLVVRGWHALARPVHVIFELHGFDELDAAIESLRTLQRLADPKALPPLNAPPPPIHERLRQALLALDGSLAGATYRQIATTIFGEERVSTEWSAASRFLKDRVRRLVAKGHALMNGGYRDLLR